jgi:hypothetical protein
MIPSNHEPTTLERLIDALQGALLTAQIIERQARQNADDTKQLAVSLTLASTYARELRAPDKEGPQ